MTQLNLIEEEVHAGFEKFLYEAGKPSADGEYSQSILLLAFEAGINMGLSKCTKFIKENGYKLTK